MSFTTVWLWTLFRSLLLIAIALPWCGWLVRWIRTSSPVLRVWQLALLALPFLYPELLTGYAYSQMTRLLITGWWTREVWFDLLLLLRVIPIGTFLWYYSPPSPLSREAWYARRLAIRSGVPSWKRWGILAWYWLQGPARSALFAACGLFLVLFQEFELASLLATTSWTVWLFDAQAGGLPLAESLRYCLAPAICTWLICGPLPWQLCGASLRSAEQTTSEVPMSRLGNGLLWGYLIFALTVIVVYPCLLIGRDTIPGVLALLGNAVQLRGLIQGILVAAGYGLMAGLSADLLAGCLIGVGTDSTKATKSTAWRQLAVIGSGVGLCGSLVIGLVGVAIFQQAWLQQVYDTPVPVVLGLIIWLLPRALLLHGMLVVTSSPVAEHVASLLMRAGDRTRMRAAGEILWQLRDRSATIVRLLLCHWAYWELTLPDILRPNGLEPITVRLYIDMHFGRNAMLTAKAGLTLAAPLLLLGLCWPWMKRRSA